MLSLSIFTTQAPGTDHESIVERATRYPRRTPAASDSHDDSFLSQCPDILSGHHPLCWTPFGG